MFMGKEKYMVVAVDYFTKWVEAEPLGSITAMAMVNFVSKSIVCKLRVLEVLVIDNKTQFDKEQL